MFGRKKRKTYFGANIEPRCEYCANGVAVAEGCRCLLGLAPEETGGACRKFAYDPLKRAPRPAPKLASFDPEDFAL